jgi:hypothetical protein
VVRTHEQIAERLMHVPGVTAAGLSSSIGMDGATGTNPFSSRTGQVLGRRPHADPKALGKRIGGMPGEWFEIMGVVARHVRCGFGRPRRRRGAGDVSSCPSRIRHRPGSRPASGHLTTIENV